MPSILASAIIDKAEIVLLDTTNIRWPQAELLGWLNDGQREICIHKPDACVQNKSVLLTAGSKQTLGAGSTSDAVMFLDMPRNMGTNGSTAGRAIRPVSREILDTQNPDWHTDTQAAEVKHYTFDPRDPKHVYVWPPNTGTGYAEMVYAAAPTDVAAVGNAISIDDIFNNTLIDYILYRAYSKDAQYAANGARAVAHYQAFAGALGIKTNNQVAMNPNMQHTPFNPNQPSGQPPAVQKA